MINILLGSLITGLTWLISKLLKGRIPSEVVRAIVTIVIYVIMLLLGYQYAAPMLAKIGQ